MLPCNVPELRDWSIVGMNHFRQGGERHLFVAMTRAGRCIVAEGEDEAGVFRSLASQARALERTLEREERIPELPVQPL